MSAANKKYQQIKKYEISRKAREFNEQKKLKTNKFPHCRGIFDTCPSEEEFNALLKEKKAAAVCGRCPVFQDSKVKSITVVSDRILKEDDLELRKRVFGK